MKETIAVIGLGYVGLPLALALKDSYQVVGFDANEERINELQHGVDQNGEVSSHWIENSQIKFTSDIAFLKGVETFIIAVPTPLDKNLNPDLTMLKDASELVGSIMPVRSLVIYESTVYPGVTEEVCAPILEACSDSIYNLDFFIGYSPERIDPGNKINTLFNTCKLVSGSNTRVANIVKSIYKNAGIKDVYITSSIKVAEAAKVLENIQRDVNIALINEMAMLFNRLGIDTEEVLKAAETKWNFMSLRPGLVGGHCIGVDPYYLTYKAKQVDYFPRIVQTSRDINASMGEYVADKIINLILKNGALLSQSKILILGITFKENCSDIRNTQVVNVAHRLEYMKADVAIYDPVASSEEVLTAYGITLLKKEELEDEKYDVVAIMVSHNEFKIMGAQGIHRLGKKRHMIYDAKYILNKTESDERL